MTCPIQMHTPEELHGIPLLLQNPLMPVTMGYSHDLGEMDLLDLDLDLSKAQVTASALENVKIEQDFCCIQLQKASHMHYKHTRINDVDYGGIYLSLDGNLLRLSREHQKLILS